MSLPLCMACYVIRTSWVKINAVTNFKINQMQGAKKYQRFSGIRREPSESESVTLTNIRKGRSLTNTTYNPSEKVFIPNRKNKKHPKKNAIKGKLTLPENHNIKLHLGGFIRNISIKSNPIETKDIRNVTSSIDLSLIYYQNKTPCSIAFSQSSLASARKKYLDATGAALFYVNIHANGMFDYFTTQEQDDLLHWQYVKKEDKYLVQLPVDLDLLTFSLIELDQEEFVLNLDLVYDNLTCKENFPVTLRSIRKLLWNNLFHNASNFFLCNRYFQDQYWRKVIYGITTIWVGYDLACSEMLYEGEKLRMYEHIEEKDTINYVVSFVTFYLSLQFIWIFALLELDKDPGTSLLFYRKNDRPYGLKRFILKSIYKKCPCTSENMLCKSLHSLHKVCSNCITNPENVEDPVRRLLLLTWCCILFPFGLYRTFARYLLNTYFFHSYLEVVKPSEPLYSWFPSEYVVVLIDGFTAILVPLFFVCRGNHLYKKFITNNSTFNKSKTPNHEMETSFGESMPLLHAATSKCYSWDNRKKNESQEKTNSERKNLEEDNSQVIEMHEVTHSKLIDSEEDNTQVKEPQETATSESKESGGKRQEKDTSEITNSKISDNFVKPFYDMLSSLCFLVSCKCFEHWNYNKIGNCTGLKYFGNVFINLIYCLFPIIPFICDQLRSCECISCCECLERRNYCRCYSFCYRCTCKGCKCSKCCTVTMGFIATLVCLRPIISTFTFIFRSFTYFFVMLLLRIHLMRLTLLFVSILIYVLKYMTEIINMNVDILNHIICLETNLSKSTKTISDDGASNEKISEETFDDVYKELSFVKRRLYFVSLKILIVGMYLNITISLFAKHKEYLIGVNFKESLEILLFIIGPYAVAFVLKTDKGDYLSEENKIEIKDIYDRKNNTSVLEAGSQQNDNNC